MPFDLLKRSFDLLILVFSASEISFDLFKLQFAFSFQCFSQAKSALTFSNPSLLSHLSISRIYDNDRTCSKTIADLPEFSQADL